MCNNRNSSGTTSLKYVLIGKLTDCLQMLMFPKVIPFFSPNYILHIYSQVIMLAVELDIAIVVISSKQNLSKISSK